MRSCKQFVSKSTFYRHCLEQDSATQPPISPSESLKNLVDTANIEDESIFEAYYLCLKQVVVSKVTLYLNYSSARTFYYNHFDLVLLNMDSGGFYNRRSPSVHFGGTSNYYSGILDQAEAVNRVPSHTSGYAEIDLKLERLIKLAGNQHKETESIK